MSLYTIALFIHISGAIGYLLSSAIWLLGLSIVRRARSVEQLRAIMQMIAQTGPISGISLLLLLICGLYMAGSTWSFTPGWIIVALVGLILSVPVSALLIEPRRRAIARLAQETPDGPIPETLEQLIRNPVLRATVLTMTTFLLGIVFLMCTKPDLVGSISVMAVALVVGLGSSLLLMALPRQRATASVN